MAAAKPRTPKKVRKILAPADIYVPPALYDDGQYGHRMPQHNQEYEVYKMTPRRKFETQYDNLNRSLRDDSFELSRQKPKHFWSHRMIKHCEDLAASYPVSERKKSEIVQHYLQKRKIAM